MDYETCCCLVSVGSVVEMAVGRAVKEIMKSTQLNIENDTIVVNEQRNIKRFDDKFIIFDGFRDTTNFLLKLDFYSHLFIFFSSFACIIFTFTHTFAWKVIHL